MLTDGNEIVDDDGGDHDDHDVVISDD